MQNKKNTGKQLLMVLAILLALMILGLAVFAALQFFGKNSLYQKGGDEKPTLSGETLEEEEELWQEGDIRYQGRIYRYNEDLLTFLFLGIDEAGPVVRKKEGIHGGQSDSIFLMCLNPHTKVISIIAVHRDTMTEVDIYTESGNYLDTIQAQITLQHGYGDGAELSCERTLACVRKLFYNIPIHGYCSINVGAIPLLNDAIGGVTLTMTEDFYSGTTKFKAGETVTLKGEQAHNFVRFRGDEFNSAAARLARQKQYIIAYMTQAAQALKENPALAVNLYQTLSKYMVTDIGIDEVTYLASQVVDYTFSGEQMYSVQGETVAGEEFEEFYPDEEALYDLILKVFYEEVTQ